jgi:hypothetical protein
MTKLFLAQFSETAGNVRDEVVLTQSAYVYKVVETEGLYIVPAGIKTKEEFLEKLDSFKEAETLSGLYGQNLYMLDSIEDDTLYWDKTSKEYYKGSTIKSRWGDNTYLENYENGEWRYYEVSATAELDVEFLGEENGIKKFNFDGVEFTVAYKDGWDIVDGIPDLGDIKGIRKSVLKAHLEWVKGTKEALYAGVPSLQEDDCDIFESGNQEDFEECLKQIGIKKWEWTERGLVVDGLFMSFSDFDDNVEDVILDDYGHAIVKSQLNSLGGDDDSDWDWGIYAHGDKYVAHCSADCAGDNYVLCDTLKDAKEAMSFLFDGFFENSEAKKEALNILEGIEG